MPADEAAWAFPPNGPPSATSPSKTKLVRPPGAPAPMIEAQAHDISHAVDWRPAQHAGMPPAVAGTGRPGAYACGYCHLPDGRGRPENAALAGLPADYIVAQVAAFGGGTRGKDAAERSPPWFMDQAAAQVTPPEIAAAAAYFSKVKFTSHVKVVEATTIPKVEARAFIYRAAEPAGREPLGRRIIEVPESFERFELRDGEITYTAYVPPGSIARGRAFAASGGGKSQPCATCHGVGLKGAPIAPPLAGRSPTAIFRQLYGIQSGARTDPGAALMKPIVAALTVDDMIDLAAYAASLKP